MTAKLLPAEPPAALADKARWDEELFLLCREDDYAGIYRLFLARYSITSEACGSCGPFCGANGRQCMRPAGDRACLIAGRCQGLGAPEEPPRG